MPSAESKLGTLDLREDEDDVELLSETAGETPTIDIRY